MLKIILVVFVELIAIVTVSYLWTHQDKMIVWEDKMLDKLAKKIANIIVYFRNFKETKPLKPIYYSLAIIVTLFIVCAVATVAAGEGADELEPMIVTSEEDTEFTCEIMETTEVDTTITTTTTTTLVESTKKPTTTAAPTTTVVTTTKRQTTAPSAAENGKYLGKFKITVYCACRKCCGKYADNRPLDENGNPIVYGAHGRILVPQYSIATDPRVIPSGTKVIINGKVYRADDTGGAVKGNVIDVYCGTDHSEALKIASQYSKYEEVYLK